MKKIIILKSLLKLLSVKEWMGRKLKKPPRISSSAAVRRAENEDGLRNHSINADILVGSRRLIISKYLFNSVAVVTRPSSMPFAGLTLQVCKGSDGGKAPISLTTLTLSGRVECLRQTRQERKERARLEGIYRRPFGPSSPMPNIKYTNSRKEPGSGIALVERMRIPQPMGRVEVDVEGTVSPRGLILVPRLCK